MALFLVFAIITQLQFQRISDDKLYSARVEAWETDVKATESAQRAYNDCVVSIETRDTYRNIFTGVKNLFELAANLPVLLLPGSEEALQYQQQFLLGIENLITGPVEEGLPVKTLADCPKKPGPIPPRPER